MTDPINTDAMLSEAQRVLNRRKRMGVKDRFIPVTICDIEKLVAVLDLNKSLTTDMMQKMEVVQ